MGGPGGLRPPGGGHGGRRPPSSAFDPLRRGLFAVIAGAALVGAAPIRGEDLPDTPAQGYPVGLQVPLIEPPVPEDGEKAVFPRPLRSKPRRESDHPAARGKLPPFYQSLPDARLPAFIEGPEDMEEELTQSFLKRYSAPWGIAWLEGVRERAAPVTWFVKARIAEKGLPEDLYYLPVVESGYLATAVSRSGAAGMWQFMKNSIGPFGIKVNEWVDERMDFWKSTDAALSKLQENLDTLGNWPLALAAYNAGLGAAQKAVQTHGTTDYWALSRKKAFAAETIQYVPQLLAVSYILSNPRRHGLDFSWEADPQWTRVPLKRQVDLSMLAKAAGLEAASLKEANRELKRNITPEGFLLKVPEADSAKVQAALERKDLPLIQYYSHTIKQGDTLLAIASRYGVSVETILKANPGTRERYLRLGAVLVVPAIKGAAAPKPAAKAAPAKSAPAKAAASSASRTAFTGSHLVKKGETLWSIAKAYGTTPEALAAANKMRVNDILLAGKTIKTPGKKR